MIRTDTDLNRQLLRIRFEGTVRAHEAETNVGKVEQCLQDLDPGFTLLADLSDLERMEDECAPFIIRIMDFCSEKGVTSIYRIVPDPTKDIGLNIMSRFHYGREVHIVTFENREEAEEALADLGVRDRE